jgi:hypothetical protein
VRCTGQPDEEDRSCVVNVELVCPSLIVLQPEKEDCVVLESLAAVDAHERSGSTRPEVAVLVRADSGAGIGIGRRSIGVQWGLI